jgi:ComF family protein
MGRSFRLPSWPCELCGAPAGLSGICPPCLRDLPWIGAACPLCARPRDAPGPCDRCLGDPPPWVRAIAPLAWRFPVDALVGRFKYGGALHFGAMLGRVLAECCRERPADGIVPVPLHARRLAERGFNQARELARPVSRALGVTVLDGFCRRVIETPPQAGLSARQRIRNLQGAFVASGSAAGMRLAVIDDVLTTGSTVAALSHALLSAGAASVEVWTVARGGTAQEGVKV